MGKTKLEIDPFRFRAISVSYNARGVLSMLMALACESDLYGVVQSDGTPLTTLELFMNLPGDKSDLEAGIQELISKRIVVYTDSETPYVIPFMIKEHSISEKRKIAGKKGGNPALLKKKGQPRKSVTPEGVEIYLTKKGRKLIDPQLKAFNIFWGVFNYPSGKAEAADAWLDLKVNNDMFPLIVAGAKREADKRPGKLDKGLTPIMAQGWLHSRRWEDKI